MLCMETIAKIRLLYFTKKKTVSEIARLVRMSRNTVYKYLHHDGDVPKYNRRSSAKPQLGPHESILQKYGVRVAPITVIDDNVLYGTFADQKSRLDAVLDG